MKNQIVSIGEILFDKYPDYTCMGGAPFNFAFHLHNRGFDIGFMSCIGNDYYGKEILRFMNQYKMPIDLISIDQVHKTGEVQVQLDSQGIPVFTIKDNMAYDFIKPTSALVRYPETSIDLFYFGTLMQRNIVSRSTLFELLNKIQDTALILYDINLRQEFYSREIIEKSLSACTVLKANDEELLCIKKFFHLKGDEYSVIQQLIKLFDLSSVCVTKGGKGASLYHLNQDYHIENSKEHDKSIIDTVGAGDGFAAGIGMGLLLGWPSEDILFKADRFARALCHIKGALPTDQSFYEQFFPLSE